MIVTGSFSIISFYATLFHKHAVETVTKFRMMSTRMQAERAILTRKIMYGIQFNECEPGPTATFNK